MIARLGAQCDSSATTHNLISFQLMSLSLINNPTPSLPWTSSVSRSYSNPSLALVSLHSPLSFGLGFSLGVACEKNRGLTPVTVIQLFFFGENGNGRWSRHQRQLFLLVARALTLSTWHGAGGRGELEKSTLPAAEASRPVSG